MQSYDQYRLLAVERRGKVLVVTMNRPPVNASNSAMHGELSRIFGEIARDDLVEVVVLTGAGRAFSAGGDLDEMRDRLDQPERWLNSMREAREIVLSMLDLDKPIIARVNGHAIGLGATLALLCDIVIAVESAKIADSHVKVGLVAGDGGALVWPHRVGITRAKEYLLTGTPINAVEAERIGLINHVVPADQLDARVYELADALAAGASRAIRLTKRALNMGLKRDALAMIDAQLGFETESFLSEEHRSAVRHFGKEK